jgi:broad specificity phosphatase PhoE
MTRVLLIRHGETSWNRGRRWQGHADVVLSEEGLAQATRLAQHLRNCGESIQTVYSSDLRRALDTGREIATALGAELVADPAWREIDVGRWTGLSREQVRERFADDWRRIAAGEDLPRGGGETFGAFSSRIAAALEQLRHRHEGESVAVITHGGAIRATLLSALGLPWIRLGEVDAVPNTAINELVWKMDRWTIARRNHVAHLATQETV